jgi:hypothetical protein
MQKNAHGVEQKGRLERLPYLVGIRSDLGVGRHWYLKTLPSPDTVETESTDVTEKPDWHRHVDTG